MCSKWPDHVKWQTLPPLLLLWREWFIWATSSVKCLVVSGDCIPTEFVPTVDLPAASAPTPTVGPAQAGTTSSSNLPIGPAAGVYMFVFLFNTISVYVRKCFSAVCCQLSASPVLSLSVLHCPLPPPPHTHTNTLPKLADRSFSFYPTTAFYFILSDGIACFIPHHSLC